MKIILGSQSLGRQRMLEEMGFKFEVMAADIDEKIIRHQDPRELTLALARAKAAALKSRIFEPAILITSDQVVVWEGQIREKPQDEQEAREFLAGYNVFPAQTVTAVVVTNLATGKQVEQVDVAKVYFSAFSEQEIADLICQKAVFNWAGGFSIDNGICSAHIDKIEGAEDSVIGLPKVITRQLIQAALA